MAELSEEQLYAMDDEALEAAFAEAKYAADDEPSVEVDDEAIVEDEVVTEEPTETEDDDVEYDTEDNIDDEDLEQPADDEDSDNNDDDTEDTDDETEETSEDGDESSKPNDETTKDDETEDQKVEESKPVQTRKYKANGKEFEFTDDEIFEKFGQVFGQAANYTQKMQAIKPWRKTIDAIEQAELTHDDVNLMIDVLKTGDKDAVAEILKRTGVDALELSDLETDRQYIAKDYGRDEKTLDMHDVINEISADPEYATTKRVLSSDWDDDSWKELSADPEKIKLLHTDVKSGMYQQLLPEMEKLKLYDRGRKRDLDYYIEAAQGHFSKVERQQMEAQAAEQARVQREAEEAEQRKIAEVKAKQEKTQKVKNESAKRKAAAPTKKSAAGTKKTTDYLDIDDDEFDKWYNDLQESM